MEPNREMERQLIRRLCAVQTTLREVEAMIPKSGRISISMRRTSAGVEVDGIVDAVIRLNRATLDLQTACSALYVVVNRGAPVSFEPVPLRAEPGEPRLWGQRLNATAAARLQMLEDVGDYPDPDDADPATENC